MKNKKAKAILSITGYFLLVLALCLSASLVFHNLYYELIYVSGGSMSPTLNKHASESVENDDKEGSLVDFGIVDNHASAIKNIKRFSIVSTYFDSDYDENGNLYPNSRIKIKRVIAMPNEKFKIEQSKLYVYEKDEYQYIPYTFQTLPSVEDAYTGKDYDSITPLNDDEYWVLGDNRGASHDCGSSDILRPIKKKYILGVLVAIEGQARLKKKQGSATEYDLVNKQYHWPKYF